MLAMATTTVSVYRGTATNSYADTVDDNTTALSTGVPASILEQRRSTTRQVAGRGQSTRYYTVRLPHNSGVQLGDRLKDERDGRYFAVTEVHRSQNPAMAGDLVASAERSTTTN